MAIHAPRRSAATLLAASMLFVLLAATPALATGIRLSRSIGPPTSTTTVSGAGFGANEGVDVTFDGTRIARATADGSGAFSKKIAVPASALPGDHEVKATGRSSGSFATATFLVRTDWPRGEYDALNSGLNPYENVLTTSDVTGLTEDWFTGASGSPVVVGGLVYVNTATGLSAFDEATGTLQWESGVQTDGYAAPEVSKGVIYAGGAAGGLVAIDARTGVVGWTGGTIGLITSASPVVWGGSVFVGTSSGHVYGFPTACADPCAPTWVVDLSPADILSNPAVQDGVVYVTTHKGYTYGYVYAFDAATGNEIWNAYGDPVGTPPVVMGTTVYAARGGQIFAYPTSCSTPCAPLWSTKPLNAGFRTLSGANGVLYGWTDPSLRAYDATTGDQLWSASPGSAGIAPGAPAAANGVLYAVSEEGDLRVLDATTGQVLITYDTADTSAGRSAPAVVDGTVFFTGYNAQGSTLHAYRLTG